MASAFPTALPNSKTDYDNNDLVASADQNSQGEDINAIAAKVGIDGSADTNSLDYKINNIATLEIASGAEVNTGTDNLKYVTAKAVADSNVAMIADIPVKATGAESNVGSNDAKFLTPLAFATAKHTVTAYTPAGAGTTTLDLSLGDIFRVTMPAATQTLAISNASVGQEFVVEIVNTTGQGALTWFSTITYARDGAMPPLTGTNTKVDTYRFRVTSAGNYLCYDDDTYVKKDATQTLTNKTLTTPTINSPTITPPRGWNGWLDPNATWTYASASTFTVSGDVTAVYTTGTRLKWTQTGVRYGVVVSSAYGAPNTTVTIAVNTDYVISNAAISANYYSYEVNPQGYPDIFNMTPTLYASTSDPDLGTSPTKWGRFKVTGRTCNYRFGFYFGSSPGAGTGTYRVGLPINAGSPLGVNIDRYYGTGYILDSGSSTQRIVMYRIITDQFADRMFDSYTANDYALITNAAPWTWAQGDEIGGEIVYEI